MSNIQMQRFNIYNLLTFNYAVINSIIPFIFFSPSNTRIQRQPRPKTNGFWTDVFPVLVDGNGYNSFQKHFRITLTTFRTIVIRLETHPAFILNSSNAIPIWKQIAIVLWRLANGVGIRVLEQTLGVSQGFVRSQLIKVIQGFEHGESGLENRKLPNVIGVMDGTHISIHPPSKNGARYINRKIFHSINLLGVVDHRERFTYIYVGEAGSVHDARVFYRSSLYHEISLHPEQWVPGGTYIIADAAYPLRTYLMKAFPDYYMLNHRERHFNKVLSSMRMVIE
ncbi:4891_t:CDS:2 [Funneliformis mosseae]|uniref:4891_t:CDS:1 n=1 Tax=Funneliformis mosseae TaxID=27381 RepID=A0A9N9BC23_FUNMO|nr:4891_t:CDS:2 [Funneliformis mosseae]